MTAVRLVGGVMMAIAVAGGRAGAIDLTGTWSVEGQTGQSQLVDVVQNGTAVTLTMDPGFGLPSVFTGTFDEATLQLSVQIPMMAAGVSARVLSNGNWFDGRLNLGSPPQFTDRVLAHRCECLDGNAADGDGCDARCQVEPCFSCSGMPSTCVPTPDGGACDDRGDCTSGETCSAGVCGGGAPLSGCIDMTGLWDVHYQLEGYALDGIRRAEQRDGVVLFGSASDPAPGMLGTIDTASGAFEFEAPRLSILCSGSELLAGTLAADGGSFAASGTSTQVTFRLCFPVSFSSVGTRRTCGDGTVDAGEQCDDGNVLSGDGCDANCMPTGCGNGVITAGESCDDGNTVGGDGCSATCTPEWCGNGVREGAEECDDNNLVSGDGCDANCRVTGCGNGVLTAGEACDDGNAVAGDGCAGACAIEPCWRCTGDQPSQCAPRYANTCVRPRDPHRATLLLRRSADPARNAIGLRSGDTGTVDALGLGDPRAGTDYQICLFDRSGATPALLLGARAPAGGTCGSRSCWRDVRGGFAYRSPAGTPHGIAKLLVVGDDRGDGRVLAVGRGAGLAAAPSGLPSLPLPAPLEVQVQNAAGAGCWAIDLPAAGVRRNDPATGRFSARGAP